MYPCPVGTPATPVNVEYDKGGRRTTKSFPDVYAARRWYIAKFNAGKNPHIINPSKEASK